MVFIKSVNIQDNHCWLLSLNSRCWLQHERLPHTDKYLIIGMLLDWTWYSIIHCVYHLLAADKSSILGGATSHMSDLARGQQRQQKWIHKPRAERPPDPRPAVILCKIVLTIFFPFDSIYRLFLKVALILTQQSHHSVTHSHELYLVAHSVTMIYWDP